MSKKLSHTVVPLDYPVTEGGVEMSQLSIRRPRVKDQINASKTTGDDVEREVALLANLCEVAPSTIAEMDLKDYQKLQKAYTDFLS